MAEAPKVLNNPLARIYIEKGISRVKQSLVVESPYKDSFLPEVHLQTDMFVLNEEFSILSSQGFNRHTFYDQLTAGARDLWKRTQRRTAEVIGVLHLQSTSRYEEAQEILSGELVHSYAQIRLGLPFDARLRLDRGDGHFLADDKGEVYGLPNAFLVNNGAVELLDVATRVFARDRHQLSGRIKGIRKTLDHPNGRLAIACAIQELTGSDVDIKPDQAINVVIVGDPGPTEQELLMTSGYTGVFPPATSSNLFELTAETMRRVAS